MQNVVKYDILYVWTNKCVCPLSATSWRKCGRRKKSFWNKSTASFRGESGSHSFSCPKQQEKEDSLPDQPSSESDQEAEQKQPVQGQETRTREIICPRQGGTHLRRGEGPFEIQEDPIPRLAKTGRQIQYHVRAGESDSG